MAAQGAPNTVTEVVKPQAPSPDAPPAPEVAPPQDKPPEVSEPVASETPKPDVTPEPLAPRAEPVDVTGKPPEITPPSDDVVAILPQVSPRPQARPADRVAPKPVAQPPEPDTKIDPVVREKTDPNEASNTPKPEEPATAPKEAVTEIVPEAKDKVSAAPKTSIRPKTRPARPKPAAKPDTKTAVNSALAEALGGGNTTSQQSGNNGQTGTDPLTQGEKDGLIVAVSECWTVDPGAASGKVTVVVSVRLNRDGRLAASPKFVSSSGGEKAAVDAAFRNARTAIISCGQRGFDLPEEKYEHWQEIEMTFNPEKMRLR